MKVDKKNAIIEFETKEGLSSVKLQNVNNVMYDNKATEDQKEKGIGDWVVGFTADGHRFGMTCQSEQEAKDTYHAIKEFM